VAELSRSEKGQSLVEFALVIPIVVLLMVGLFDLGHVVFENNTLSDGARQGARIASVNPRAAAYCADVDEAVRSATRGLEFDIYTVTYQTINSTGAVSGTYLVCSGGAATGALLPSTARPGDRVVVALGASVPLATPLISRATGRPGFDLTAESTMQVTFVPGSSGP
jgi:Flp pilus assembly protein TadG